MPMMITMITTKMTTPMSTKNPQKPLLPAGKSAALLPLL